MVYLDLLLLRFEDFVVYLTRKVKLVNLLSGFIEKNPETTLSVEFNKTLIGSNLYNIILNFFCI